MPRYLLLLIGALLLVWGAATFYKQGVEHAAAKSTSTTVASGEATLGGPFMLLNQQGETVKDEELRGKLMLVFFGFTHCPEICPTGLNTLSEILTLLGDDAENVHALFITLDPERDTVAQMADYVVNFHPSIQALTGDQAQIDTVLKAYKVYAKKIPMAGSDDYMMDHSSFFYLMDKQGKFITHFPYNTPAEDITAKVRENL